MTQLRAEIVFLPSRGRILTTITLTVGANRSTDWLINLTDDGYRKMYDNLMQEGWSVTRSFSWPWRFSKKEDRPKMFRLILVSLLPPITSPPISPATHAALWGVMIWIIILQGKSKAKAEQYALTMNTHWNWGQMARKMETSAMLLLNVARVRT